MLITRHDQPTMVLMSVDRYLKLVALDQVPQWAKPILATALELQTAIDAQP